MSISKRLVNGFLASGFGQVVTILNQVVSVPFFLQSWGVQLYGEWLMLSTVPTYLVMSDFGFSIVAGNKMTVLEGRGDRAESIRTFHNLVAFVTAISFFLTLILAGWYYWGNIEEIFSFKAIPQKDLNATFCLLYAYAILGLWGGVFTAGYKCTQKFALSNVVNNLSRLSEFAVVLILLAKGFGIVHVCLGLFITKLVFTLIMGWYLVNLHPWLGLSFKQASIKEMKALIKPSLSYLSFPIGTAISIQGMVAIIGSLVGAQALVVFNTTRTLTRIVVQWNMMVKTNIEPELCIAMGKGELTVAQKIHLLGCKLSIYFSVLGGLALALFSPLIINTWLGEDFSFDYNLLFILLTGNLFYSFWTVSSSVSISVSKHQYVANLFFVSTIFTALTAYLVLSYVGITGVALLLLLVDAVMAYLVLYHSLKVLQSSFNDFVHGFFYYEFRELGLINQILLKIRLRKGNS